MTHEEGLLQNVKELEKRLPEEIPPEEQEERVEGLVIHSSAFIHLIFLILLS